MEYFIEYFENNNKIIYKDGKKVPNLSVDFFGKGSTVSIGADCTSSNSLIRLGNNCNIEIGKNCILNCLEVYALNSSSIVIGDYAKFTWSVRIHAHEPYNVKIGDDCLFADGVWITVSDMHAIIDKETRERINPGKSVTVGDHVWIGASATVLKGSIIEDGAVVATGSIVSGRVPPHSIAAGIPARIIRSGIEWINELDTSIYPTDLSSLEK